MPKPGSTSLKPSTSRSAALDLRAKVIGTNTLIVELTGEIRKLVEAQREMVAALTVLMTRPIVAAEAVRPFVGFGPATATMLRPGEQQALSMGKMAAEAIRQRDEELATPAPRETILGPVSDTAPSLVGEKVAVPRGTPGFFANLSPEQQAAALAYDGPDDLGAPVDFNTDAALIAELADLQAEDDIPPPPDDDGLWVKRLQLHRSLRMWKPEWGPRPGQAGCEAPRHLLNGG